MESPCWISQGHRSPQIRSSSVRAAARRRHRRRGRGSRDPFRSGDRRAPLDLDVLPRMDGWLISDRPVLRPRPPRPLVMPPLQQDVAAARSTGAPPVDLVGFGVFRRRKRVGTGGEVGEVVTVAVLILLGLGCGWWRVRGSGTGSDTEGLGVEGRVVWDLAGGVVDVVFAGGGGCSDAAWRAAIGQSKAIWAHSLVSATISIKISKKLCENKFSQI